MTASQGVSALLKRVKQVALGTPGSSGSQYMRRVTFTGNKQSDTYNSNEIVSHQQSTGATEGPSRIAAALAGEMSPGSYALEYAALLRRDFTAVTPIASLALTIAASGSVYTVTRGSGDFLAGGIKIGYVVRLSVGSLAAANLSKNLVVLGVTATVLTVTPLNGSTMTAEGPIAGCTVSVPGKATWAPTTGHTNDYFTFEMWAPDASVSELFTDLKPASADVAIPATGKITNNFDIPGLGRTIGASEVLTSPTAASSTSTLEAVNGKIVANGTVTAVTNLQFKIDGATSTGDPEVGSNSLSDLQRGRISVSGSFSAKFTSSTLMALRDSQTVIALIAGAADSGLAAADFEVFCFPTIKLFSDDVDDGEKIRVRTYNFTAQYNGAGGSGVATNQTICQLHDSQAA